jgi:hypothetical protein
MSSTYTLISKVVLTDDLTTSVTFSSIPQTYTHLVLKTSVRHVIDQATGNLGFNLSGGSTQYFNRYVRGSGTSVTIPTLTDGAGYVWFGSQGNSTTASVFSSADTLVADYTSNLPKMILGHSIIEQQASAGNNVLSCFLTNAASPVTSMLVQVAGGLAMRAGSSFSLYGISHK